MADIFEIAGRIHSTSREEVAAVANEILDTVKNKKQDEINTETYTLVNDINERLSGLSPDQQSALSVAAKATNNEIKLGYYVCGTEGNVAAKVISNATGYVLSTGGSIKVKMTNANTTDNATLNINSTGAKPLYYDGVRASANNTWEAGETVEVYYDGTNFYANNVAGGGGDGVFDVSEKYPTSGVEGGNTYTLQGALTVLNANLSASKKKGGMSIKFIQSSDNKYVQYRLMATSFSTTESDWQGVDEVPTAGSHNLVESGGVSKYLRELSVIPFNVISPSYISDGWKLKGEGKCAADENYQIVKFAVTEGEILSIHASKDNDYVMQFQVGKDIPSYAPNTNLIGNVYTTSIDALLKVPTSATYLMLSQLKRDEPTYNVGRSSYKDVEVSETTPYGKSLAKIQLNDTPYVIHDGNIAEIGNVRYDLNVDANKITLLAGQYNYPFDDHYGNRTYINVPERITYTFNSGDVLVFDKSTSQVICQPNSSTTDNQVVLLAYDAYAGFSTNGLWGNVILKQQMKNQMKKDKPYVDSIFYAGYMKIDKHVVSTGTIMPSGSSIREWGNDIIVKVLSCDVETTTNKLYFDYIAGGSHHYNEYIELSAGSVAVIHNSQSITSLNIYVTSIDSVTNDGDVSILLTYSDVATSEKRGEINESKIKAFEYNEQYYRNITDNTISEIIWSKKYTSSNGDIGDSEQHFITPKIYCKKGDTIEVSSGETGGYFIGFDSNDQKAEFWGMHTMPRTFTLSQDGVVYARFTAVKAATDGTVYVKVNNELKFAWSPNMLDVMSASEKADIANEKTTDLIQDDTYITSIADKVANSIDGDNLVFLQITDTHAGSSSMTLEKSAAHMNMACKVASSVNADFVVHTGDAIHGYESSASSAVDSWKALMSKINNYSTPILFAEGNYVHDFGYNGELEREQVQTYGGRFGKWANSSAKYNDSDTVKSYYYFDNVRSKVRFFVLDAQDYGENRISYGFHNLQVNFVANALTDALSKDYKTVFFAHMPPVAELMDNSYGMGEQGAAMVAAIGSFTSNGGTVLAYIYGHLHSDNYYYDYINKIPYICCQQDWVIGGDTISVMPEWGNAKKYAKETDGIRQYSMDADVINVLTGKIHTFRYGAGRDRIFNTEPKIVNIGSTEAIKSELSGTLSWFINDTTIATVQNNVVTGVSTGNTWLMAEDKNGVREYFVIVVS